jgi:hypothetical protein
MISDNATFLCSRDKSQQCKNSIKIHIFWDIMPCQLGNTYPCFKVLQCLQLQGQADQKTLMM